MNKGPGVITSDCYIILCPPGDDLHSRQAVLTPRFRSTSLKAQRIMPPIPEPVPAVWNQIAAIQNNWGKFEPWHKGCTQTIGALGVANRWNPKPDVDNEEKVVEEDLLEDEPAIVAQEINRRIFNEFQLVRFNDDLSEEANALPKLMKRIGIGI